MLDPAAPRVLSRTGNGRPVRDSGSDPGGCWAVHSAGDGNLKKAERLMARSVYALEKGDMIIHATDDHMVIRRNGGDVEILELLHNKDNGRFYSRRPLSIEDDREA